MSSTTSLRKRKRKRSRKEKDPKPEKRELAKTVSENIETIILDSDDDDSIDLDRALCVSKNKVALSRRDLMCLKPRVWLNDAIIDFSLEVLQNKYDTAGITYVSPSFFFAQVIEAARKGRDVYAVTKKWINVDLFEKKLWLIPVCQRDHWYLIAVDRPGNKRSTILVMNSLSKIRLDGQTNLLVDFLEKKQAEEGKKVTRVPVYVADIPQQENQYDCGLHLIRSAEILFAHRKKFVREAEEGKIDEELWDRAPLMSRNMLEEMILRYSLDQISSQ